MHPLFLLAACSLFSCNPTVRKPRRMGQPGRPRINVQCGERLSNLAVFADVYVNLPQSDRKFRKNLSRCFTTGLKALRRKILSSAQRNSSPFGKKGRSPLFSSVILTGEDIMSRTFSSSGANTTATFSRLIYCRMEIKCDELYISRWNAIVCTLKQRTATSTFG